MEKTKSIRQFDEIGRVILSFEIRQAMGWDEQTLLEISISGAGNEVVLESAAYQNMK